MIAASGTVGTAGFLIYIADATGYVGSCALLIWRNFGMVKLNWLQVFTASACVTSVLGAVLVGMSAVFFLRKGTDPQRQTASSTRYSPRTSS